MRKVSKKLTEAQKLVDKTKVYSLEEAMKLAKETSYTKFDGSIDLAIKLNLDTRKAEQQLRGAVVLPHGTGKKVSVLVLTDNTELQKFSKEAGADFVVSGPELEEMITAKNFNYDVIVAEPKMMVLLGKHGKTLGTKGLMPNPKTGTVTPTPHVAVAEIKKGKANYRADKAGIVHSLVGKSSMTVEQLTENAQTLISLIKKLKPSVVKGTYIQNLTVSASMGPSIKIKID